MGGSLMEGVVTHQFIQGNGVKLHYVEAGSGPTVLLLHGFPDFWYSWRHQIPALVNAGYHVVAPDTRGYGESEMAPVEECSSLHVVGDLVALLDALQVQKALVVGHDFGAAHGTDLALFRPDRVKALMLLGAPYSPRSSKANVVDIFHNALGDDHYTWVFQEPGVAEKLFKPVNNEDIFSAFYLRWNSSKNLSIPPFVPNETLPEWLTKGDLKAYAETFEKSGWTGSLNHYRALSRSWGLKAPWTNATFPCRVPLAVVMGRQDIIIRLFEVLGYKLNEETFEAGCRMTAPSLKSIRYIDAAHFMHQEKPKEINAFIIDFLEQHKE